MSGIAEYTFIVFLVGINLDIVYLLPAVLAVKFAGRGEVLARIFVKVGITGLGDEAYLRVIVRPACVAAVDIAGIDVKRDHNLLRRAVAGMVVGYRRLLLRTGSCHKHCGHRHEQGFKMFHISVYVDVVVKVGIGVCRGG